jgi:hypothetical protein
MTVKELIEQLQQLDPELRVFVQGYEGGYNDAGPISDIKDIALDYHKGTWYYGSHEDVNAYELGPSHSFEIVKGIIL